MSSSDWLPKLPSVNEILEKPPLRGVVERLNRSAVTARVRSFLEDIREEVQARTGEISLSELAERAARYVLGPAARGSGSAINATGQLWGDPWNELPLAEAAIERAMLASRNFTSGSSLPNEAERVACELTGAESAALWHSRMGALELALRALAAGKAVVVGRGEMGQFTRECRVTDLAAASGASLIEVGSIDSTTVNDYMEALTLHPEMLLRIEAADYVVLGQSERVKITELAEVARQARLPLLVDLGWNPLVDGLPTDGRETIAVRQALADGADLVLVRADGFIGGPPGALLLGKADLVDRVKRQPLAAAHRANGTTAAALVATLELAGDLERARFSIPILSLLDTPLENLRTRAERLAPQMTGPHFASVEPVQLPVPANPLPRSCHLPSWGIRLVPQDGNLARVGEMLANAEYPVIVRTQAEHYLLDLRTVFPRQDIDLVTAANSN